MTVRVVRITLSVVLCAGLLLPTGCISGGAATPREAALAWARALISADNEQARLWRRGDYTDAEIARDRLALGMSRDSSEDILSVDSESLLDASALERISFRRRGAILRPPVPIACYMLESGWFVSGVATVATGTQKQKIDRTVTGLLTGLAANDATLAAPFQSHQTAYITGTRDLVPLREQAFGSTAIPVGFKMLAIPEEKTTSDGLWFAMALVQVAGPSGPNTFAVDLSGRRESPSADATPTVWNALRRQRR